MEDEDEDWRQRRRRGRRNKSAEGQAETSGDCEVGCREATGKNKIKIFRKNRNRKISVFCGNLQEWVATNSS
jgi:hypothetical protein